MLLISSHDPSHAGTAGEEGGPGAALAGAAVSGLYTGLKFTGLAVRVAGGLAASIGKDAERAMSALDAQRKAQVRTLSCQHLLD